MERDADLDDWRHRVDAVWASSDDLAPAELVARIDALAAERPGEAVALFESAGARDSTGDEAGAEARYREAIAAGLPASLRAQAGIQLASTLRNLGRAEEGLVLLRAAAADPDAPAEYAPAFAVFEALLLHSLGRPGDALATAIDALVPHLPRYQRSATAYADALRTPGQRG